jgi:hypothetical protein
MFINLQPGLILGGAWGFKEGFSRPLGNNTSFKLRLNSVLNGCTRRGTFVGNSLGVLGASNVSCDTMDRTMLTNSHLLQLDKLVARWIQGQARYSQQHGRRCGRWIDLQVYWYVCISHYLLWTNADPKLELGPLWLVPPWELDSQRAGRGSRH